MLEEMQLFPQKNNNIDNNFNFDTLNINNIKDISYNDSNFFENLELAEKKHKDKLRHLSLLKEEKFNNIYTFTPFYNKNNNKNHYKLKSENFLDRIKYYERKKKNSFNKLKEEIDNNIPKPKVNNSNNINFKNFIKNSKQYEKDKKNKLEELKKISYQNFTFKPKLINNNKFSVKSNFNERNKLFLINKENKINQINQNKNKEFSFIPKINNNIDNPNYNKNNNNEYNKKDIFNRLFDYQKVYKKNIEQKKKDYEENYSFKPYISKYSLQLAENKRLNNNNNNNNFNYLNIAPLLSQQIDDLTNIQNVNLNNNNFINLINNKFTNSFIKKPSNGLIDENFNSIQTLSRSTNEIINIPSMSNRDYKNFEKNKIKSKSVKKINLNSQSNEITDFDDKYLFSKTFNNSYNSSSVDKNKNINIINSNNSNNNINNNNININNNYNFNENESNIEKIANIMKQNSNFDINNNNLNDKKNTNMNSNNNNNNNFKNKKIIQNFDYYDFL